MKKETTNKAGAFMLIFLVVLLLDQAVKTLLRNILGFGNNFELLPFLNITMIKNTGAGFGILQGQNMPLILISVIAVGAILFLYDKIPEKGIALVSISLILGGILSNLTDRLVFGAVLDFIDFGFWPVFNFADAALTLGAIGLIIYSFKKDE